MWKFYKISLLLRQNIDIVETVINLYLLFATQPGTQTLPSLGKLPRGNLRKDRDDLFLYLKQLATLFVTFIQVHLSIGKDISLNKEGTGGASILFCVYFFAKILHRL